MSQVLVFTNAPAVELEKLMAGRAESGIYILADSNTVRLVVPALQAECPSLAAASVITVMAGDGNKSLDSLATVWRELTRRGATRRSVLVNVGGGMVTDLGGFAAATFKRGMSFVNVPTTLLGAVDAAVGGKTGINFEGLKNEIGAFREAEAVIISARFFDTLPLSELLSGYAEMLKHALIDSSEALRRVMAYDFGERDYDALLRLLSDSVEVKRRIVAEDPYEKGLRRALNLGHTVAHAFESMAMERNVPVPHGHAVAWGLVVDLVLSHMRLVFSTAVLRDVAAFVGRYYPVPRLTCNDYPHLMELMGHDKKNTCAGAVNFTLLSAPGKVVIDQVVPSDDIAAALDIFRDLMHI